MDVKRIITRLATAGGRTAGYDIRAARLTLAELRQLHDLITQDLLAEDNQGPKAGNTRSGNGQRTITRPAIGNTIQRV